MGLYRQSLSTFRSSCCDDFSSVLSLHSCSEAVRSFSWCVMRLVCSFHLNDPSSVWFRYTMVPERFYLDAILPENGLKDSN